MALTITQRTRSRIALVSGVLLVVALWAAQLAAPVGTAWRDAALITASVPPCARTATPGRSNAPT